MFSGEPLAKVQRQRQRQLEEAQREEEVERRREEQEERERAGNVVHHSVLDQHREVKPKNAYTTKSYIRHHHQPRIWWVGFVAFEYTASQHVDGLGPDAQEAASRDEVICFLVYRCVDSGRVVYFFVIRCYCYIS